MGKSTVVLVPCRDYDPARVEAAVRAALSHFDLAGIVAGARSAGGPVLLKPNLLSPSAPEKGVTTHPSVFTAVATVLRERGAELAFGDSPMGLHAPIAAARRSGIFDAAERLGIPMADFETAEEVSWPRGLQNRRFPVARGAIRAGAIVSLPRLKTHGLTEMTGALKNTFGVVPGNLKMEFHIRHPEPQGFSRMLVDLNGCIRPRLFVLDAVMAMEGNGPGNGDLVPVGLLIVSDDPVATDAVGCRIMGIDPMKNVLVRRAHDAGLGNARASDIAIIGEPLEPYVKPGFRIPHRAPGAAVPQFLWRFARNAFVARPVIDPDACTRCGECVEACPTAPKSLVQERGAVPVHDYRTCIRCYCCQEGCRHGAISLQVPPLGRILAPRTR